MSMLLTRLHNGYISKSCRQRSYHVESTGTSPITEGKQRRARRLALGRVTSWKPPGVIGNLFVFFVIII